MASFAPVMRLINARVCHACSMQRSKVLLRSIATSTKSGVTPSRTIDPFTRRSAGSLPYTRQFSSSQFRRAYKTVEEAKSKYRLGPFSWQAGLLFLSAGVGLTFYFRHEKARMNRLRIAEHSKGVGRPLVGGPFTLIDHDHKPFTEQNLKGKYSLVYFGFTNCPDICPEELDKMAGMIDNVKKQHGNVMKPVFITCDPARDTPAVIKAYLNEFHEDILGLTGEYDEVKAACKAYRVYFSTPQDVKPGQDYLVDHSIYFYLMGMFRLYISVTTH